MAKLLSKMNLALFSLISLLIIGLYITQIVLANPDTTRVTLTTAASNTYNGGDANGGLTGDINCEYTIDTITAPTGTINQINCSVYIDSYNTKQTPVETIKCLECLDSSCTAYNQVGATYTVAVIGWHYFANEFPSYCDTSEETCYFAIEACELGHIQDNVVLTDAYAGFNFTVTDDTPPQWSNNETSVANGSEYAPDKVYQFNVTWNDPQTSVSVVFIEHNFTGGAAPHNDTVTTNDGDIYYFDVSDLPVGTYVWKEFANNTDDYWNVTNDGNYWVYVVDKNQTNPVDLYIDNGTVYKNQNVTIDYGTQTDTNGTAVYSDSGTVYLYRNGSSIDNPDIATLGSGSYEYKTNMTGNANYSDNSTGVTYYVFINKGTANMVLISNVTWSTTYPNASNVTGSGCPTQGSSDFTCNLYRNTSGLVASGEPTAEETILLGAESHQYVWNMSISNPANWTFNTTNNVLVISQNTSTENYMNLTLGTGSSGTEDNKTYTYPTTTNTTGWYNNSAFVGPVPEFKLYRNDTEITNGNPVSEVIELAADYYQYVYNTSGNANYSLASKTFFLNITKADNPVDLYLNGSINQNRSYTYPEPTNATGTTIIGNVYLYRDNVEVASGVSPQTEEIILGNGTYAYKVNSTGNANYSDNSTGVTYYALINKGTVQPSLSINTTWTETYPESTNVSCSVNSLNDEVSCLLWRDDVSKTNPEEILLGVGSYVYKTNTSVTSNYSANDTGESNTLTIQVNTSSDINLFLNGSQANFDMNLSDPLNTTAVLVVPISGDIEIWTNYSDGGWNLWDSCTDCSSLENVNVLMQVGFWNFTANFTNANYSSAYDSWYANVTTTADITSPNWTQQGSNTTLLGVGEAIKLYANWSDDNDLDYAWLATNETGIWENKTNDYSSPIDINLSVDETWSNFTWQNTSTTAGTTVGWRIYANDSSGNENVTDIQTFILNVTELWNYTTDSMIFSSAAIADVNGDSIIDVVIGSDDGNVYALNGTGGEKIWNYSTDGEVGSSPSLANVTGGDDLEVIVGSFDYNIYVLNGTNGSKIWNYTTSGVVWSSAAIEDIDNDDELDIVIGSDDYSVYALNGTGDLLWSFPADDSIWSSPVIANVTDDEFFEVIFSSYDNNTYLLNASDGSKLWNYSALDKVESTPAIDDINNDGIMEIVFGSYDSHIYAINGSSGEQLWNYSANDWVISSPVITNIEGSLKVIVGSDDGNVYALNDDGTLFWSFTVPTGGRIESSPAIADMNDDGVNDVIIGSSDNRVYAINGSTGTEIWNYNTRGYIYSSPSVEDVNGDGLLDIIVGSFDNNVYTLDPPSSWNMFGGNQKRTRVLDRSSPINLNYGTESIDGYTTIYSHWRDLYSNLALGIVEENSTGIVTNHSFTLFGTINWVNYTIENCSESQNCKKNCMEMWKSCEKTKIECREQMKQCRENCRNSLEETIEYKIYVFDTFGNVGIIENVFECG